MGPFAFRRVAGDHRPFVRPRRTTRRRSPGVLAAAALGCLLPAAPFAAAVAQEAPDVPPRVLFVVSGGFWENLDDTAPETDAPESDAPETDAAEADGASPGAAEEGADGTDADMAARGYYRVVVTRAEDNTSRVALERLALSDEGPQRVASMPIEAINSMPAYVTDVRPENSTGMASQPGFAAYVYLKQDPSVVEPQTWVVFADEFGEVTAEPASN